MADVVQYRMERMTEELDDLETRGIFTPREIGLIVKQRYKFECRLKRHSPLKQDFLSYIHYETQLDRLRALRRNLHVSHHDHNSIHQKNKKKKKSKSDIAGVLRIMNIYELALKRFKGDLHLWFQYLQFCRHKKNGRMKKALAKLVRFHPKVPQVWIYAAEWEFDHNLNVAAARALMQEGLRVNPTSEDLWVEYLRMELTYLNKLKARKVALGEDEGTLARDQSDANDKQRGDENEDTFMSLNVKTDNNENVNEEDADSDKKQALFAEHGMSIFQTVYSGAVEAVPSSLNLRQRFLEVLEGIKLANSEEMCEQILNGMKRDFLNEPEFWDWLARREYNPDNVQEMTEEAIITQMQKAIQVYEEALKSVPSSNIFRLYANCLMGFIAHKGGESDEAVNYISHLLRLCERAESMECLTEDLACDYLSFYLKLGQLDEAKKLSTKLCSGKLAECVQLWVLRITIEIKCKTRSSASLSDADLSSLFELLSHSLRKFPVSKSEDLWVMALKFYANQRLYFDKLLEISITTLARDGGSENGFSLSSAIVKFILQKNGIQQAREIYKRFLALPHPGLVLYKDCIDLETNLASIGDKDGLVNARKLYESAIATYDQDVKLWQDYYNMESKMGTTEKTAAIIWRARRILKDAGLSITSLNLG